MRLIITDSWLTKNKPLYANTGLVWAFFLSTAVLTAVLGFGLYWVVIKSWIEPAPMTLGQTQEQSAYERLNIEMLAKKVGEMQGQLIQLDALARKVSDVAGVDAAKELDADDGKGGLLEQESSLSTQELLHYVTDLRDSVQYASDLLTLSQARVSEKHLDSLVMPTQSPAPGARKGSGFGWRIDPFTGKRASHMGVDFPGPRGLPVLASAGGVVVTVVHSKTGYGNHVEIDHGNKLITRYAHLSSVAVKAGDLIKKGQRIGKLGSTGRSTGPHLHFEVLLDGKWVNPNRFLNAGSKKIALSR